jgi:hypothetical protein
LPLTELGGLPLQAACCIFAAGSAANPLPVFIAEVPNVWNEVIAIEARDTTPSDFGATLLYYHFETDSAARQAEVLDLILAYNPPMNVGRTPSDFHQT